MKKIFSIKKGFTLLELLIVIGILAILATTITIILNPAELLKQSRDVKRIAELSALDKALEFYSFDGGTNFGSTSTVYISIPDTSSTCNNVSSTLPVLPTNWSYNCVTSDNLRKINGNGWIPIDFTSIANSPLNVLPIDPLNTADNYYPSYYSYTVGSWKLIANLESSKYQNKEINSASIYFSICPAKVKDIDNNEYSTSLIHGQCWMRENMRATKYPNGIPITRGPTDSWSIFDLGYYGCPPNTSNNAEDCAAVSALGYMYQWSAAMNGSTVSGAQGICPTGWHIPTDSEQDALERYYWTAGGSVGSCNALRSDQFECDPAGTQLKSTVFSGLLAGYRNTASPWFFFRGSYTYFLLSTQSGASASWVRYLGSSYSTVYRAARTKAYGYSVRCLKN